MDKRIPPLWESRPEDFLPAGEAAARHRPDRHSRYVEERSRASGFEGRSGGSRTRLGHAPVEPAASRAAR